MRLILTRGSDQSLRAIRVKIPLGSFNVVRRREFFFGNEGDRVDDNTRGRFENNRREKLNDERGNKPLPVSSSRDDCRTGKNFAARVGGTFCILTPEIGEPRSPETMTRRELRT